MSAALAPVQTSGQRSEPDLFGSTPAEPGATCNFTITGTVARKPVVHAHATDHGLPNVEVELDLQAGAGMVTAHLVYPASRRDEAVALAASIQPGDRATVVTALAGVRMVLPAAHLIPNRTP